MNLITQPTTDQERVDLALAVCSEIESFASARGDSELAFQAGYAITLLLMAEELAKDDAQQQAVPEIGSMQIDLMRCIADESGYGSTAWLCDRAMEALSR